MRNKPPTPEPDVIGKIFRYGSTAGGRSRSAPCSHSYEWWGEDTCKCTKCGKVVTDEEAESYANAKDLPPANQTEKDK
jgi:hypothetical protein